MHDTHIAFRGPNSAVTYIDISLAQSHLNNSGIVCLGRKANLF